MAKQKKSKASKRSPYGRASRFARDNGRTLGIVGAGLAGVAALLLGRRYRERGASGGWSGADAARTPAE